MPIFTLCGCLMELEHPGNNYPIANSNSAAPTVIVHGATGILV